MTRDSREIFLGPTDIESVYGEGETMIDKDNRHAFEGHLPALSMLLADVGRRLASGMTPEELRGTLGLSNEAADRTRGLAKLEKQREKENKWYTAAVSSSSTKPTKAH